MPVPMAAKRIGHIELRYMPPKFHPNYVHCFLNCIKIMFDPVGSFCKYFAFIACVMFSFIVSEIGVGIDAMALYEIF